MLIKSRPNTRIVKQETGVVKVCPLSSPAAQDVRRALDDAGDDGQPAQHARGDIGNAHGRKGPIGIRFSSERIELVDGRDGGQRLGAIDQHQRDSNQKQAKPQGLIAEHAGKIWQHDPIGQRRLGHINQCTRTQVEK